MEDKKNLKKYIIEFRKKQNPESFKKIYDYFFDRIYRFIFLKIYNSHDSEELAGDVMIKVYNNLAKTNIDYLSINAWVYKIAGNCVIDFFRKNKNRQGQRSIDEMLENNETVFPVNADMILKESVFLKKELGFENERLLSIMNGLPENQKNILLLKFVEDLDYPSISALLGKKENALRALLFRALQNLKEGFKKSEKKEDE
ncbi:MAG: RNA polymerase sigma factor [Actinomycetota bacterium]|jgi:RNA polymerase sigma-70 factor (ECF subfamily)|nr:RNA polymerase sigma factor [Actinomycetota bacterium]